MQGVYVLLEEHVLFPYNTYQLVVLVIVQCGILYFSGFHTHAGCSYMQIYFKIQAY